MKKFNLINWIGAASIAVAAMSCGGSNNAAQDTATSGEIRISVDETFAPIMEAQISSFQSLYPRAKINAAYKAEAQAFQDLLTDSIRFAVVTRDLNTDERATFDKWKITPRVIKIAVDGIALVVNKANADTTLTLAQVRDVFTGKIKNWKELDSKAPADPITLVFDNSNSSTARFIVDSINQKQPLPTNTYATKTNKNLIEYVAQNKNAIGVIGVNWVSDRDDPTTTRFLSQVNIVGVSRSNSPATNDDYVQPYQAYLADGTYPLRREVFIISKEARVGLGTGFASFVSGDKGQRIILKSGLVPATMPVRIVGFRE